MYLIAESFEKFSVNGPTAANVQYQPPPTIPELRSGSKDHRMFGPIDCDSLEVPIQYSCQSRSTHTMDAHLQYLTRQDNKTIDISGQQSTINARVDPVCL